MNIIEAVRSGKPFRRKGDGDHDWMVAPIELSATNILANDWEIQEPRITITKTQFFEAFGQCFCEPEFKKMAMQSSFGLLLANKLGLK